MDLKKENHKLREQIASLKHNLAYVENKNAVGSSTSQRKLPGREDSAKSPLRITHSKSAS